VKYLLNISAMVEGVDADRGCDTGLVVLPINIVSSMFGSLLLSLYWRYKCLNVLNAEVRFEN
jgi:hypothetical protein